MGTASRYWLVLVVILMAISGYWFQERVAANVVLEGRDVSGLTRQEVERQVQALADDDPGISVADTVKTLLRAAPGARVQAVRCLKTIASYSTPLLDQEPNRVHNIRLTVQKLNGYKIRAGQVFSFNESVGQPTKADGYKAATILADNGSKIRELGGGMCQVSSTLYNVALGAKLEIVERHAHAKPVKYVPQGRDATTYTDLDLKFRNNTNKILVIRGQVTEEEVRLYLQSS